MLISRSLRSIVVHALALGIFTISCANVTDLDVSQDAGSGASGGGGTAPDAGADVDATDGGCYRDPYVPDNFVPPCEQPEVRANCDAGWCTIEPGCFIMGAPWCEWGRQSDSTDPMQVTLTRRFRIQQFELTQAEWVAQGLPNPSGVSEEVGEDCLEPSCPVGNVTWTEALAFANLLSSRAGLPECYVLSDCTGALGEGMRCDRVRTEPPKATDCPGYRLPTGAEWEYAARAGTRTSVYSGEVVERSDMILCVDDPVLSPIAWYCANAGNTSHAVGQKEPNAFGLYDVIGNAAEWAASLAEPYTGGPHVDWGAELALQGLASSPVPAQLRGGIFHSTPSNLRSAAIWASSASARFPAWSFRLVQSLP